MKVVYFSISLIITLAVLITLNTAFDKIPPFGKFLSPQHGFWQNAEPIDNASSCSIDVTRLNDEVQVYFDNRMVPHVFAANETDAYYVQGYLHARHRLWQMEFQVLAAAGRLSEILGVGADSAYLNNDRKMRRMGMVYGAERSLAQMEGDESTRQQLTAYTEGVNNYLSEMTTSQLPLEYRLLNYRPEKWSNLKTALLLKYLSLDLAGGETDIENTNARSFFSEEDYNKLYPLINDSADPVVPKGTVYPSPLVDVKIPAGADSVYFNWKRQVAITTPPVDKDKGSNNWAVGPSKTRSGRPILCNDPHLGLNLPSLWYEIQLTTPQFSVYGASLPGAPAVVIGFNDSIAWGVTNSARDVLDFYEIQFNENDQTSYWYNNQLRKTELRVEKYFIKDGSYFYDTVAYTVFGPVMYDQHYNGRGRVAAGLNLAIRWKAHDPSNEFKTFNLLNKATNYNDYQTAISYFQCPGQNFAFASKAGDIALWHQGNFPAKWRRQGDFIMPGKDSSYQWQADIPHEENPHIINPERGFISSANQIPADTSYPYYLNTDYDVYRGAVINRFLSGMNDITPEDMQKLQNENYNLFAETALPFLLKHIKDSLLSDEERRYLTIVRTWNRRNDAQERGATVFTVWYDVLEQAVWDDEYAQVGAPVDKPGQYTLIEILKKDSAFSFIDDVSTPDKETISDVVTNAFRKASTTLMFTERDGRLTWGRFKDSGIRHLLRMEQLSRFHLNTGGGSHIINATKQYNGPSWRMVVHLTDEVEAYGIYPGGQNGNPGSKGYDEFVDDWAAGKYYRLWMMKKNESSDRRVKMVMNFTRDENSKRD